MKTGLLGAGLKSSDYSISLSNVLIPKNENNFSTNQITFNQGNSYACTLFACFTLLANKFSLPFIDDEWILNKWYNDAVLHYGANAKVGWYISSAVDYTRNWFNSQEDLVKKYGRLTTGFLNLPYSWTVGETKSKALQLFEEISRNGHDFVGGHNGSKFYNEDFQSDGILNLKKLSNPSYAHCICISASIQEKFDLILDYLVANSWKGVNNNVYRIQYLQDLIDNSVLFQTVYTFFSDKDEIKFDRMSYSVRDELAERFDGSFVQTVPTGTIFYIGNNVALNMDKYLPDFNKRDELAKDLNDIGKNTGITEQDFMSMV